MCTSNFIFFQPLCGASPQSRSFVSRSNQEGENVGIEQKNLKLGPAHRKLQQVQKDVEKKEHKKEEDVIAAQKNVERKEKEVKAAQQKVERKEEEVQAAQEKVEAAQQEMKAAQRKVEATQLALLDNGDLSTPQGKLNQ